MRRGAYHGGRTLQRSARGRSLVVARWFTPDLRSGNGGDTTGQVLLLGDVEPRILLGDDIQRGVEQAPCPIHATCQLGQVTAVGLGEVVGSVFRHVVPMPYVASSCSTTRCSPRGAAAPEMGAQLRFGLGRQGAHHLEQSVPLIVRAGHQRVWGQGLPGMPARTRVPHPS